jgi:hypothetical protein
MTLSMKKYALLLMMILTAFSCGSDSGGKGETGLSIKPGDLTPFSGLINKEYNINLGAPCASSTSCYAVIYNATVNGTEYVGIAVDSNPSVKNSFYLVMYFPNSGGIPTLPFVLDSSNPDHKINYRQNGTTTIYPRDNSSGTLTLSFTDNGDGTYQITRTAGSVTFNSGTSTLNSLTITAAKVPY